MREWKEELAAPEKNDCGMDLCGLIEKQSEWDEEVTRRESE